MTRPQCHLKQTFKQLVKRPRGNYRSHFSPRSDSSPPVKLLPESAALAVVPLWSSLRRPRRRMPKRFGWAAISHKPGPESGGDFVTEYQLELARIGAVHQASSRGRQTTLYFPLRQNCLRILGLAQTHMKVLDATAATARASRTTLVVSSRHRCFLVRSIFSLLHRATRLKGVSIKSYRIRHVISCTFAKLVTCSP